MDLAKYIELTGKTIPESQEAYYTAVISRVSSKLETLLGWSFAPQALFQERGKSKKGCVCPDIPTALDPPDEVQGLIKVFPYNAKDKFLQVDPFVEVYTAKLVRVLDNREFITYKTFDVLNKQYLGQGIGKYLERCQTCFCDCDCKDCVSLAVDGDWLTKDNLPSELLYLWCDMVDFYSDPNRDIKSESVDGHSWSRGDIVAPEDWGASKSILVKYAGPYGVIVRVPTL